MSDPEITPELAAQILKGSLPGDLGIELLEIEDDRVRGRLVVDRRHLHGGGFVHGGGWVSLADTIAAWGTRRNLSSGWSFTTSELKMNVFAAAAPGDELVATGTPLHIGRSTQVWEVRVHRGDRLVALYVCTQLILDPG